MASPAGQPSRRTSYCNRSQAPAVNRNKGDDKPEPRPPMPDPEAQLPFDQDMLHAPDAVSPPPRDSLSTPG